MRALFDTNIVLDYLKGVEAAAAEFARYEDIAISVIARIEVLVGATPEIEKDIRGLLDYMTTVQLDPIVVERAIVLRRKERLRLADAIIWASAQANSRLFVTRDTKDFPAEYPGIRVPYRI